MYIECCLGTEYYSRGAVKQDRKEFIPSDCFNFQVYWIKFSQERKYWQNFHTNENIYQAVMHEFSAGSSSGKLQQKYYATAVCH